VNLRDVSWGEDVAFHELRVDDLGLFEVVEVPFADVALAVLELFEVHGDVVEEGVHVDVFFDAGPLEDLEVLAEQLDAERDHELGALGEEGAHGRRLAFQVALHELDELIERHEIDTKIGY
jgi:hypothetical protein